MKKRGGFTYLGLAAALAAWYNIHIYFYFFNTKNEYFYVFPFSTKMKV